MKPNIVLLCITFLFLACRQKPILPKNCQNITLIASVKQPKPITINQLLFLYNYSSQFTSLKRTTDERVYCNTLGFGYSGASISGVMGNGEGNNGNCTYQKNKLYIFQNHSDKIEIQFHVKNTQELVNYSSQELQEKRQGYLNHLDSTFDDKGNKRKMNEQERQNLVSRFMENLKHHQKSIVLFDKVMYSSKNNYSLLYHKDLLLNGYKPLPTNDSLMHTYKNNRYQISTIYKPNFNHFTLEIRPTNN